MKDTVRPIQSQKKLSFIHPFSGADFKSCFFKTDIGHERSTKENGKVIPENQE